MPRTRRLALALLLPLLGLAPAACASGGGGSSGPRGSSTLIIEAELEELANLSAYEAVQRLRPSWLQVRGGANTPVVMVDGSQMGGLEALRNLSAGMIREIRFRNGRDATTRYGTGFGGGAIEVATKG